MNTNKTFLERFVTSKKIKVAKDIDGLPIFLEMEIKLENGRERNKQTINHEPALWYLTLSIRGHAWDARRKDHAYSGQIYDELNDQNIKEYLIPSEKLAYIVGIWKRWHLNDLKAGCIHQGSVNANDPEWTEKADKETKKCPVGYGYGSAWLVEPLPLEIVGEITGIFNKFSND